jgi:hypothetical protein
MKTRTEYLKLAKECDRLANETKTERQPTALKEMAEAWRKLAEEPDGAERPYKQEPRSGCGRGLEFRR